MAFDSFNAYHSYLKSIDPLNDAERGRLFTACLEYSMTGEAPDLRGNERFVFPVMKERIDRDKTRYAAKCEANRKNVKKRWSDTNVYDRIPSNTNVYDHIPPNTFVCEGEKEERAPLVPPSPSPPTTPVTPSPYNPPSPEEKEGTAHARGSEVQKPKRKQFTTPTLEEVTAYAESRGHPELAKKFFEYFTVGNWIDAKGNPVRNWKQKFLTWEANGKDRHGQPARKNSTYVEHGGEMGDFERRAMQKMMERGLPDG